MRKGAGNTWNSIDRIWFSTIMQVNVSVIIRLLFAVFLDPESEKRREKNQRGRNFRLSWTQRAGKGVKRTKEEGISVFFGPVEREKA